ncbi:MAG: DUF4321 domain-containing protein [Ruminococcus sp.]|nr:DUF4321 domain-containing protein [Ruminococcus sp.]MDD6098684.1 DUF4321 domain-containing protein [Oscillospiraceae bacterium]
MKKVLLMSVMIITAIVVGALLGDACAGVGFLNWLSYSKCFSFQPGTIDINVFSLTFGISFEANVAQLLLVFAGIFAYYKIAPKIITK